MEDHGAKPGHANHGTRLRLIGGRTAGRVPGIRDRERYHSPDCQLLRRRDRQHGGRLRCSHRCRDGYWPHKGAGRHYEGLAPYIRGGAGVSSPLRG